MKKHILILSFIIYHSSFTISSCSAQNLVPNPSFEDTGVCGCPIGIGQSALPSEWYVYERTPDYFNVCSPQTNNNSIPSSSWGYQYPAFGDAYCGAWSYQTIQPNTREYLGIQLLIPTVVGQKYYASMKVSLAEISNCGINKIGILFSNIPPPVPICYSYSFDSTLRNNYAQIYSLDKITDTSIWTNISGSFIADSVYKYIIIGNFFKDNETDTTILGPPKIFGYGAYYYLDDIYISTDSNSEIIQGFFEASIEIFPNPVNSILHIYCKKKQDIIIKIYNITGELLLQTKKSDTNIDIDFSQYSNGIYFLQIKTDKKIINKKLFIN